MAEGWTCSAPEAGPRSETSRTPSRSIHTGPSRNVNPPWIREAVSVGPGRGGSAGAAGSQTPGGAPGDSTGAAATSGASRAVAAAVAGIAARSREAAPITAVAGRDRNRDILTDMIVNVAFAGGHAS